MPHYKNFDSLRLVAASSVIFSHSFLIADGHERNEPFIGLFGRVLGVYGVFIFFILSGLLVTQSMFSSDSVKSFSLKRFLRIYPGLFICNVVTISVAVAVLYGGSLSQFVAERGKATLEAFAFVRGSLFYDNGPELYSSQSHLGAVLNGSLWTIRQELICYIAVGAFFWFRLLNIRTAVLLVCIGLILRYCEYWGFNKFTSDLIFVLPSFCSGMAMYFILRRYRPSGRIALACVCLLAVSVYTRILEYSFPLLVTYLVAYLGTSARVNLGNAARFGDLSYGTYLYGWPIEQAVRYSFGEGVHWWTVFCISLPIALIFAFISWHLVERPAVTLVKAKSQRRGHSKAIPIVEAAAG